MCVELSGERLSGRKYLDMELLEEASTSPRGVTPYRWTGKDLRLPGGYLSVVTPFVIVWAEVVEVRVATLQVAETFDVAEHGRAKTGPDQPGVPVEEFGLQAGEGALGHGVIRSHIAPAHARHDAGGCEVPAEVADAVDRPLVRITPAVGLRLACAIARPARARSVPTVSSTAQPTPGLSSVSMATAK